MIQVADYSFDLGDKGMTFGTSTTSSVHIQTIASDNMATKICGRVLQVGSMLVSINGRHISMEYNALELVRERASQACGLTFSIAPKRCITWFEHNYDVQTPLVEQENGDSRSRTRDIWYSADINTIS
jgi:hypothetical protein